MNIYVVSNGSSGQAAGKALAKHGHEVTFLDSKETVRHISSKGRSAASPAKDGTPITSDITFFCVPAPLSNDGPDLNNLKNAVGDFALRLKTHKKYHVIVIRSNVVPGTTRKNLIPLIERYSGKKAGVDFGIVVQPDYSRKDTASQDAARPWFILIGQYDEKSGDIIEKLYSKFDAPIERVSLEEAEFQKYVHNAYNAMKIAFFNEVRSIAKNEKWNYDAVLLATVESSEGIWNPLYGTKDMGPFEGPSLPGDTLSLLQWSEKQGYSLEILRSIIAENVKHKKQTSHYKPAAARKAGKGNA